MSEQRSAAPTQPATSPEHHRRNKIIAWCTLACLLVIILILAIHHVETAKKVKPPVPGIAITTATATKGDIGIFLDAIGTVTPVYTASITSQVNGQVIAVHFKEGQLVKKGDALIDIDPRMYIATLRQAQGTLERDENLLAQAKMDVERYRKAWAGEAVSKQVLDDQEKLVLQDQGVVKTDQGTVQVDELQVEFCHIVAPISGKIGLRLVDPGNVVQSSGAVTLAVITQINPITVIFTIAEDSLGEVQARLNAHARLNVYAYERTAQKIIATGQLLTLDNQIDTTTGTIKGRALFDNNNDALFPNQFINTRLLVNTIQGATLIPASAIQQNGQASFVYVIQNQVAAMRSVKPGVTNAGFTQVTGLNPGEVVANSSFDKLQDKSKVTLPVQAASTGTPAGTPAAGSPAAGPPAAGPPAATKPAPSGTAP